VKCILLQEIGCIWQGLFDFPENTGHASPGVSGRDILSSGEVSLNAQGRKPLDFKCHASILTAACFLTLIKQEELYVE